MLEIKDLHVSREGNKILKGLSLHLKPGEVHAIMGPNGSGKSTLGKVIAGDPVFTIDRGEILFTHDFKERSLLAVSPEQRAQMGIFLSFQYPPELQGVNNLGFLRASFNAICRGGGIEEMDEPTFRDFAHNKIQELHIQDTFLARDVNVDFSGGEKKRNEILQLAVLSPRLAILDEIDSGLDVDALKTVADYLQAGQTSERALVLITHYHRLLKHIKPDYVHILHNGVVAHTGDHTLAHHIEKKGFQEVLASLPPAAQGAPVP